VEWAHVHGHHYGTPRASIEAKATLVVFDIDVQGGEQILSRWPASTVTVLVVPPSPAELERRLRGRSTESDEAVRARLAAARAEVARAALRYEYVLVNDRVEEALGRLVAISRSRRGPGAAPGDAEIARASRTGEVDLSAWGA
jgi:guanylate kinase